MKKNPGKNLAKRYRNWYGVDWRCAFMELELLGVPQDPAYVKAVLDDIAAQSAARARRKQEQEERLRIELDFNAWVDEIF